MDQYIGKMLDNRYELLELIGRGGMANVYKAKCHRLNRLVAIKILKSDLADSAEFRRRFHDESLAVAQLSHVNIVSVYDVSRSEDLDYIVMELIDGFTLKQYMERRGKMDWREALHFIIQIMRGLSHAHSRGIIHRDIKPQNIMVLRDGSVKVADFGIACLANSQTLTQEALGSVHYISPEQARGDRTDARSDIYSAGVVLYEMLTGRLPFEGDSAVSIAIQHLSSVPLSPRDLNPDVPEALELITMKAMNPSLDKRYPSADAMLEDLERFRKDPNVDMEYIRSQLNDPGPVDEPTMPISVDEDGSFSTHRSRLAEEEQEDRPNWKRIALIAVAVLLAILGIVFLFFGISKGLKNPNGILGITKSGNNSEKTPEYYTVPYLIGLTVEQANELPEIKGIFEVRISGAKPDPNYTPGQILEQDPAKGLKRSAKGDLVIQVIVCMDEDRQIMPNLTGTGYQEAKARLLNMNLDLDINEEKEFSDTVPAGQVIRTTPGEGEELQRGAYVLLITSKGPEKKMVQVISFLDQPLTDAASQAERLGLTVGDPIYEFSDEPDGTVIGQSINVSEEVEEGTTIYFTVSRVVTVTDYTGMEMNAAASAAKDAGLVTGFVFEESEEEPNTVIHQSLKVDSQVAEGTIIVFTISKAVEKTYSVTYMDGDGTIYTVIDNLHIGEKTPGYQPPPKDGYTFVGWSPDVTPTVNGNDIYTAQWEANSEPEPEPEPEPGGEEGN